LSSQMSKHMRISNVLSHLLLKRMRSYMVPCDEYINLDWEKLNELMHEIFHMQKRMDLNLIHP
jgi:hypothetical protein